MSAAMETYGLARFGDTLLAAMIENDGTRRAVKALTITDNNVEQVKDQNCRLFFNVPDRITIVKKIQIRPGSLIETPDLVQFEMAQSLLEPQQDFYFDALPLTAGDSDRQYLSVAYHRREIDLLMDRYQAFLRRPSGFKLNAVAMVDAYLAFCQTVPGDLQVLADIETDSVTIAIVYRRKLHGTGRLELHPGNEISSETAHALAVEFKMTLSYYLTELFQQGITVPPSHIILSGYHAGNSLIAEALARQISAEITLPPFHDGYFQLDNKDGEPPRLERFFIPLGLAVE